MSLATHVGLDEAHPSPRKAQHLDAEIGRLLRMKRCSNHLSMEDLAGNLGISYQQLGKLEHGQNRLSVARLIEASSVLGFDPGDFVNTLARADSRATEDGFDLSIYLSTLGASEAMELFATLSPRKRKIVLAVMRAMGNE